MELKKCRKGEVIIRQGETGECMYCIRWGRVGVYSGYATAGEKKLAELGADDFFGEMELLDRAERSATVVALETGTQLEIITEADFTDFFSRQPAKVFLILQRLCQKLRKSTQDYLKVCHTIYQAMEAEEGGRTRTDELDRGIADICAAWREQA